MPLPGNAGASAAGAGYLQVITDTTVPEGSGYRGEFGYAVLVVMDGRRLLFDTGVTGEVLEHNLRQAGVGAAELDAVVLSHNHPDHVGGLSHLRRAAPQVPGLAPPGQYVDEGAVQRVENLRRLSENLYVLRTHTDEPTAGIADELSLIAVTAQGPYLVTGCSHTGLGRIVEAAARLTGQDVYFHTGGARLKFRERRDAALIARRLEELGVRRISPGHCSVDHAVSRTLRENFSGETVPSVVGRRVPLPAAK